MVAPSAACSCRQTSRLLSTGLGDRVSLTVRKLNTKAKYHAWSQLDDVLRLHCTGSWRYLLSNAAAGRSCRHLML